jgi:hypothetical protein
VSPAWHVHAQRCRERARTNLRLGRVGMTRSPTATLAEGSDAEDGVQCGSARRLGSRNLPPCGGGGTGEQYRRSDLARDRQFSGGVRCCLSDLGQKGSDRDIPMTDLDRRDLPPVMVSYPVMTRRRLLMGRALMLGHLHARAIQVTCERTRRRPDKSDQDEQSGCTLHVSKSEHSKPDAIKGSDSAPPLMAPEFHESTSPSPTPQVRPPPSA